MVDRLAEIRFPRAVVNQKGGHSGASFQAREHRGEVERERLQRLHGLAANLDFRLQSLAGEID
jgi:hypothetical protein